ncbi:MAG: hypothetical protein COS84_08190 [Armatimonadetes bacterium CG07_land_8_20_14_0_80_40_9]|nr:MAG: hypothetical protein COS84_08190 [Armatimonadetes bacterium CG07_land_8_20_14_0_80_40_9]
MMGQNIERKIIGILRVLSGAGEPIGANLIARQLRHLGIVLDGRTVRYHLKIMDEQGLTKKEGREGRLITPKGLSELEDALVSDRVGLIITQIESLSYQVTFNPWKKEGKVILNTSLIKKDKFKEALSIIKRVLKSRIGMSILVICRQEGERIGDLVIPKGEIGLGTVCSITINGILLKEGIPVEAKLGGIVQVSDFVPQRFTELVTYGGSTLDPLEIFMQSNMTSVLNAVGAGSGKILANLREIPAVALDKAEVILEGLKQIGLAGTVIVGRPGQPVLEVSPGLDRVGIVVLGGLNPLAAVEESGIKTESKAISTLVNFSELRPIEEIK